MEGKTHKQTPPQNPGQSRENVVYVFFFQCFFAPREGGGEGAAEKGVKRGLKKAHTP